MGGSSSSNCQIPDLPTAVSDHSTIQTFTGIISCGGYTNGFITTNKCHRLNKNGQWVDFPGMKKRRGYFSMFEANKTLFAVGGVGAENSFESIDLMNAKEWRKEKDLPFRVDSHCVTRYNETHFLLTGGELNYRNSKKTKWFDVQTKKWSNGPEMNKDRSGHGCVKIPQTVQRKSQILVVGGLSSDSTIESLEIGEDKWKVVGSTNPEVNLNSHSVTESYSPKYIAYSIGGHSNSGYVKSIYGMKDDFSFAKVGELKKPRRWHQSLNLLTHEIPNCL